MNFIKKNILNLLLALAILITLYFSFVWYSADDSGEAVFAIITTLLIPLILYLKRDKPKSYNIEVQKKELILDDNIDIEYPKIKFPDNSIIESRINQTIEYCYFKYGIDIENSTSNPNLSVESGFEHLYTINNIFGLTIGLHTYFKGAAHPNNDLISINIDLNNGGTFEFKDLFKSKFQKNILIKVKKKLLNNKCGNSYFDIEKLKLREDQDFYFDVENKKLVIIFPKYEIAPGMCNIIEVELKFSKISKYVNPSGPLSFIYNPALDNNHYEKKSVMDFSLMQVEKISKEIKQQLKKKN